MMRHSAGRLTGAARLRHIGGRQDLRTAARGVARMPATN